MLGDHVAALERQDPAGDSNPDDAQNDSGQPRGTTRYTVGLSVTSAFVGSFGDLKGRDLDLEPVGEARSNADVFLELSARLGLAQNTDPSGELEEIMRTLHEADRAGTFGAAEGDEE